MAGPPYSVGSDAEEEDGLPIICRQARRALEAQREKLAKNWVLAGLLSGEHDVLEWILQDRQLSKCLGSNHHITIRGDDLIQLSKYSVEFQLRSVPARRFTDHVDPADQADPACAVFAKHIAVVVARRAHVMRMAMTAASTTLTAERMRAIAETAGVRLLHVACQASEPEVWRVILRELLVASMRDPETNWNNLTGAIAFADGKAALEPAVADSFASVLREVATRGPVVIALHDAHLLGVGTASLLNRVMDRIEGQPIGFVLVDGEDTKETLTRSCCGC